jgi:hypothetical protein
MGKLIQQNGYDFAFDPKACDKCQGRCCIGESGSIWVNPQEITTLANALHVQRDVFINNYLIKIGYRYSIKEEIFNDGFRCVFFDVKEKKCSVYENRPTQCRTFPFWEHFKNHISEVEEECPGIYKV